jgi:hypothetical protein
MDYSTAHGAIVVILQVLHNAGFAKCVQAFCNGCGINQIPSTEATGDVLVDVQYLYRVLHEYDSVRKGF